MQNHCVFADYEVVRGKREKYSIIEPVYLLVCLIIRKRMLNIMERMIHMNKKVAVILVALIVAGVIGLSMYNELSPEDKDVARADCPEAFNSKGELIDIKTLVRVGGIGIRDSEEYCEVHNTLFHGNDHGTGIASINLGAGYSSYDPERWVESLKLSSAHWSILMRRDVSTIYVVYGEHACCMDIW